LKQDIREEDILAELLPALPGRLEETTAVCEQPIITKKVATVYHSRGQYYFIPTPYKRITAPLIMNFTITGLRRTDIVLFNDT
jgi:hypothetical protein